MPGAYAHITLVNLAKETRRLDKVPQFPPKAIGFLNKHSKFCELGAVSPDYPYLAIMNDNAKKWADLMHYTMTGDLVKSGVHLVRNLPEEERERAFAWLAGYLSHVTVDVTIHPVVELKVGSYVGNEMQHRMCEMHQDAHIYKRLDLGDVGLSEHLDSGIWACCVPAGSGKLDNAVKKLWASMLESVHPGEFAANGPDIDHWHSRFKTMVDKIGEEGNKLWPIARHVAVNCGLTYPSPNQLDKQFLEGLATPEGNKHYDEIFNRALENVTKMWTHLAKAVFNGDEGYRAAIGNWNLDTGRDENNRYVFWENRA